MFYTTIIPSSDFGSIANGSSNTIAGGHCNWIFHNDGTVTYGTVGGGYQNRIWNNTSSFIGGGYINKVENLSDYGTIGGGYKNLINYDGNYNTIGGGKWNKIDSNADYSFIGGGDWNYIRADWATIGGGYWNKITTSSDFGTIAGGDTNRVEKKWGTVGGGELNVVTSNGEHATIPGGRENIAQSYGQTVVGVFNRAVGSATASDFNTQPIALPKGDEPLFIVGNGKSGSRSNAAEISNNGHLTVYDVNGSGGATIPGRPMLKGSTYKDNVIYAWGHVNYQAAFPQYIVVSDFATAAVAHVPNTGDYVITLNITDPVTNLAYNLVDAAVTATLVDNESNEQTLCSFINVTRVVGNVFTVKIRYGTDCSRIDRSFMFHVTGR